MDKEGRKGVAVEFLKKADNPKAFVRQHFSPDCKHHNPYFKAGMDALTDGMMAAAKNAGTGGRFDIGEVLADGNLVAVHTHLHRSGKPGGFVQVHLFRFSGEKVVEYWDVTQQVPSKSPNEDGAF